MFLGCQVQIVKVNKVRKYDGICACSLVKMNLIFFFAVNISSVIQSTRDVMGDREMRECEKPS